MSTRKDIPEKKYDVIILGSGSGGVRLARRLAQAGKRVAMVGKHDIGGTCVNLGCVPKKLFASIARVRNYNAREKKITWRSTAAEFAWPEIVQFKTQYIEKLRQMYVKNMQNISVDMYEGNGEFVNDRTIQTKTDLLTADNIVIAVGTKPALLPIDGQEHISTSDNLFSLSELPRKCLIVGMGYIALETAWFLKAMGSEVIMAQHNDRCLSAFDRDLANKLSEALQGQGIEFIWNVELMKIEKNQGLVCTLSNKSKIGVDRVFVAVGRVANTDYLNLNAVDVKTDAKGFITVDENYRTSQRNIFALGDVIGGLQLTPVAIKQAEILAEYLIHGRVASPMSEFVPTAVFTDPQVASVGVSDTLVSEAQRAKLSVYQKSYVSIQESFFSNPFSTFIKLVCEKETNRVVGLHMMSNDAAEIVQAFSPLLDVGVTLKQLDHSIRLHPTVAEDLLSW